MHNKSKALLCLCAAAAPSAAIYACAHRLMKERPLEMLYEKRAADKDFVPLSEIPERMVLFLLETEDPGFFRHPGYMIVNICDAVKTNLREKRIVAGGSTITQQLVKNLYFRFTKNFIRKAAELLISLQAEKRLGKNRILEMYLNTAYFGNGVYGISDAARFYFGRDVRGLSVNQMFILACMSHAPTKGNPIQHPDAFERTRDMQLKSFVKGPDPLLNEDEAKLISSYHADCLDPDLRRADEWTRNYPQDAVLVNERFGPFSVPSYRNPMDA